ncbi:MULTISPECIES: hypothetical protein [Streptomyces]|uniref:hypothetical protein n=1 Tax=Streptomyces TaxID=1883 RepID=UPI00089D51F3|nr:hypothetical protein [Streptomyces sp. PAN_FS17]SEC89584.1 hypothetical protein SAMN05216482_5056 [Streptomyces sp. PAN_FS17]
MDQHHENWDYYGGLTPEIRDDVNRLGVLYETLKNDLHLGLAVDDFTTVLAGAFEAECFAVSDGRYPPVGHGYPRLES